MHDITALRFALVKTSGIGGRAVVGGDLETALDFVFLPLDHLIIKTGPLRIARVKFILGKLSRLGPSPCLCRKAFQRARPPAPLVLVAVGMQTGKQVGHGAPCAEKIGFEELNFTYCVIRFAASLNSCAKGITDFVCDRAIWMHGHWNRIFFHCHCVIEVALAVQKLLNSCHRVISDFLLRG